MTPTLLNNQQGDQGGRMQHQCYALQRRCGRLSVFDRLSPLRRVVNTLCRPPLVAALLGKPRREIS